MSRATLADLWSEAAGWSLGGWQFQGVQRGLRAEWVAWAEAPLTRDGDLSAPDIECEGPTPAGAIASLLTVLREATR